MAKNPPCNAGNVALIPGQGVKIPRAMGQLSLCSTTKESVHLNRGSCMIKQRPCVLQLRSDTAK